MATILVMAESNHHYREFIKTENLDVSHFRYVSTTHGLRGHRGDVVAVGRYWSNPVYRNIEFSHFLRGYVDCGAIRLIKGEEREHAIHLFREEILN